jgi:hypothetical protein
MNNITRLFPLLLAAALYVPLNQAHAQNTDGSATFTVTTINYAADYDPKHVTVVWVVDGSGTFVKTLCRYAVSRIGYLYKWAADRGTYTGVDGVATSTLATQPQTHTVRWDCRRTNGLIAADGTYNFRAEYTSNNAQGPYMANNCLFVKGASAVTTNFPNYSNASGQFTSLSLTYTPFNEVAVMGFTPNSGVINSNVAVVVTVTNQTFNTLSFSVAVSNVTSGLLIGTLPVTALPSRARTNLTFNWNTTGLAENTYQVRAVSSKLASETNTANNVYSGTITLSTATAGDLAVTSLTPSAGIIDGTVPLRVTVTNKTASLAGAFLVSLSNLTAATSITSYSNAWRVATSADDAEENLSTHATVINSTDLELVIDTASQVVGIRFPVVSIPKSAAISTAFIQFTDKTGENLNTDPISLTIKGQAADNAATFAATASNISSRPDTAASVAWVPPTWADAAAGPDQRTPELKSLVQEIVDRAGWASGNALAFKITGSGSRRAWANDGSPANAPLLIVKWTTASSLIATQQVASLAPSAATNLTFSWNTSGITVGVYRVVAQAGPLASETYTSDNTLTNEVALREALHDLAVRAIAVASMIPPNVVTNVLVAVTNRGDVAETFTHTLRDVTAAPILIGTRVVTNLAAYAGTNVTFSWNTATNATFTLGYHTLQADIAAVAGETDLSNNTNSLQVIIATGLTTNALVAKNATWKYLDKGLDISGAPWKTTDYYDGFWSSGPSPLGYGLANIATAIGYGGVASNRYATSYFRREFTMDFTPLSITGRLLRTHGAILYLNGVEIARQNMPDGAVAYSTPASGIVTGASATNYFGFVIAPGNVVVGRNLLTAELHLAAVTNTTAGFALELTSVNPTIPPQSVIAPSALTPDGSAQSGDAAGVTVTLSNTGNVAASCLVLIRDSATGAVLGSQTAGPLVPGETVTVQLTLSTFGATTGSRTLQAVTVCNGVTNLATVATAPFTLAPPDFAPRTVDAAGSIGGRCNAVAASGSTVFLGCGATLEAWDASNPAAPVRKAIVRLPGIIEDLAASNGWAYAATGASGVQIVDASSATQLLHRATFNTTGHARRLALAGSLLYVADVLGGVRVLNVSSPAAPTLAGAYQTTGPAQALAYASPRLLVLDGQRGLQNLHAANPAALSLTGSYSRVTAGLALAAVSGAALVSDANGGLYRVSTATPTNLTAVTNALLPAAGLSLATSGSALYVAAGAQGLLTLSAATLATSATTDVGGDASDVAVAGSTLYVAAGFGGARALNIASPLAPVPLGTFATGSRGSDAAASGSTLYVAADEGGLQIHRLQNLALPTLLGTIPSLSNSRCVAVAYPRLFVAKGYTGLEVFSIANPAAPALLGSYAASSLSHIRRIAVAGDRVVITDGKTVELLSVANPAAPALLASHQPGGFVFGLAAIGGEVYAACGGAGLKALRMDTLAEDATYATPGPATGVAAVSNRLTVACGPAGWLTLNIDNAANPVLVKATPGRSLYDAAAAGNLVYLADGARTALVANVSAPLTPVASAAFGNLTQALRVRAVSGLMITAEDEAGLAILNASPDDINLNGISDEWEQQIVDASVQTNGPVRSVLDVNLQSVGPNSYTYYQSYLAGLTPADPSSVLALSAVTPAPSGSNQITIQWRSVAGKRYTLYRSEDLAGAFTAIPGATGIVATGALTSYADSMTSARAFYMVVLTP